MAIDTRNKRASVIGFKNVPTSVFPNPDGSLANQADRQQMANEYSGIAAAAPAVDVGGQRRRRRGE